MWEYNQLSGQNDYLQHYGVLGMKWGVRRGRHSQVRAKAAKKRAKLEKKAKKAKDRSERADMNYSSRAGRRIRSETQSQRLENARRNMYKQRSKSIQAKRKLEKWDQSVEKVFSKDAIKRSDKENLKRRKEYEKNRYDYWIGEERRSSPGQSKNSHPIGDAVDELNARKRARRDAREDAMAFATHNPSKYMTKKEAEKYERRVKKLRAKGVIA